MDIQSQQCETRLHRWAESQPRRGTAAALQSHDLSQTAERHEIAWPQALVREGDRRAKAGHRPLQSPPCEPTSAEVIGVKGSCDRVARGAITSTLQTLVLLLGRV